MLCFKNVKCNNTCKSSLWYESNGGVASLWIAPVLFSHVCHHHCGIHTVHTDLKHKFNEQYFISLDSNSVCQTIKLRETEVQELKSPKTHLLISIIILKEMYVNWSIIFYVIRSPKRSKCVHICIHIYIYACLNAWYVSHVNWKE